MLPSLDEGLDNTVMSFGEYGKVLFHMDSFVELNSIEVEVT